MQKRFIIRKEGSRILLVLLSFDTIDEMDNVPSSGKNTQVSQGSSETCFRSSVEAYKKKQVGRKGPHDWKK